MRSLPSLPPRLDPLVAAVRRIARADPFLMSAAIAYNSIFALVPLAFSAVAAISIIGGDPNGLRRVEETLAAEFPADVSEVLNPILEEAEGAVGDMGPLVLVISVLVALWSGSRAIYAVQKALRMIEDVEETRPYVITRGLGILFTVGAGVALAVSYFAVIVGNWVSTELRQLGLNIVSGELISVGAILLWVFGLLFSIYHWGLPTPLRMSLPSALVSTVLLVTTTWLAAVLIPAYGGSALAAFGSVGVILVWSYTLGLIIISVPFLLPAIVDVARERTS